MLHFFSGGIEMQHLVEMGLLDEGPLHNFEGSSPWYWGQIDINLRMKHYIPKVSKFYVEKGYLSWQA